MKQLFQLLLFSLLTKNTVFLKEPTPADISTTFLPAEQLRISPISGPDFPTADTAISMTPTPLFKIPETMWNLKLISKAAQPVSESGWTGIKTELLRQTK